MLSLVPIPDPKLADEPARLAALRRYAVLDTGVEDAFETITALVRTALDVPIAIVSLIDADRQWFKSHPGILVSETPRPHAFCNHTIRSRDTLMIVDARADPRFAANPLVTGQPHIVSYAGVPLTSPDGYNVGSLCAIDRRPRDFDPAQLDVLRHSATLVVEKLELRRIAARDHLTGALTRRAFVAAAEEAIWQRDALARPAALVVFDLDRFKAINDTYGHRAGDIVLRAVGMTCIEALRDQEVLARIGGEEFAFLLPGSGIERALARAEELRALIAGLDAGINVGVSASFGVARLTPAIRSVDAWLAAADRPLYTAKRSGRDRVCRYDAAA